MSSNDATTQTRYGHTTGSGSNEPKDHEKKEQRPDWVQRQGADQTANDPTDGRPSPEAQGDRTKPADDVATRKHIEGAEQGPR